MPQTSSLPLVSIFVWTIEGLILSLFWFSYSLALRALHYDDSGTAILDFAYSSVLVTTYALTLLAHTLAVTFDNPAADQQQQQLPVWVHAIASTSQCSVVAAACITYFTTFLDACALEHTDMCSILFRGVPFPVILGGVISGLTLVLLLTSVVLATISSSGQAVDSGTPVLLLLSVIALHGHLHMYTIGSDCHQHGQGAAVSVVFLVLGFLLSCLYCLNQKKSWVKWLIILFELVLIFTNILYATADLATRAASTILAAALVAGLALSLYSDDGASKPQPNHKAAYASLKKTDQQTDSSVLQVDGGGGSSSQSCSIFVSDDVRTSLVLRQRHA